MAKRKRSSGGRTRGRKSKKSKTYKRRTARGAYLKVKRTFYLANWQPSTASTNDFWRYYSTSLAALPSASEFTSLFDAFRINAVKFVFRPRFKGFEGNDTTDTTLPGVTNQAGTRLCVIVDPMSNTVPSGVYTAAQCNGFLENGGVRIHEGNRPVTVYFKPKVDMSAGSGGVATAIRGTRPWLQTANAVNVQHNGFHVFAQDPGFAGSFGQSFDVFVTLYMAFKNLK